MIGPELRMAQTPGLPHPGISLHTSIICQVREWGASSQAATYVAITHLSTVVFSLSKTLLVAALTLNVTILSYPLCHATCA